MKFNSHDNPILLCRARSAFTLVELLLVLLILGVLAAIVYPNLAHRGEDARITAAHTQMESFCNALATFEVDNGHYPKGPTGLKDLVSRPSSAEHWRGPYIDHIPLDPWGRDYFYECPGKHKPASYDLMSPGPDGSAGTPDDITNWHAGE